MSEAQHALAIETAYLRLASAPAGMIVNAKWARAVTPQLERLLDRGDLAMIRQPRGNPDHPGRRLMVVFATQQGVDRLEGVLERHGDDFGHVNVLTSIEPLRERKEARRRRLGREPAMRAARPPRQTFHAARCG